MRWFILVCPAWWEGVLTSRSVDHDESVGDGRLDPAVEAQGVALAPTLAEHLLDVVGVQVHVHRLVDVVDVADLAVTPGGDGVAGEEAEAVLSTHEVPVLRFSGSPLARLSMALRTAT